MLLIFMFVLLILLFIYNQIILPYIYWQKKKIAHVKPWPIVGNMLGNFLGTRSFGHIVQDMYEKFPHERYFGFHHYSKPAIMLRDPDLIKQLCVTDFDTFTDHPQFLPEDADPLINRMLLLLKGKEWHNSRITLSPAFTTNGLKEIFNLIVECSKTFVLHFENGNDLTKFNARDMFARFANDVVASFSFGVDLDSIENKENEIFMIGKRTMSSETPLTYLKYFGYAAFPTIMRLLKFRFIKEEYAQTLKDHVYKTLRLRKERGLIRNDLIQFLMEVQKNRLETFYEQGDQNQIPMIADEDIFVHAAAVYFASFDTLSDFLAVLAYELAVNQDVQEKLIKEVDKTLKECQDGIRYQAIINMKYMDMVVSEALRLWPITTFSDRISVKPYIIHPKAENERPLKVDVGTYFWLPIYALHRDPKYYPNPTRFDPERFNDENKKKIKPCAFIPFGAGPRACIASRLAVLESKVIIFHILSKLRIVAVDETEIPFIMSKKGINVISESGPILGLKLRYKL